MLVHDDAADVLTIHKILVAVVNFVQCVLVGNEFRELDVTLGGRWPWAARPCPWRGCAHRSSTPPGLGLTLIPARPFVAVLMTSASTAVVVLDFISRASRRAKCHISSSVSRERRLSPATNPPAWHLSPGPVSRARRGTLAERRVGRVWLTWFARWFRPGRGRWRCASTPGR